jgi:hypothetical protein
MSEGDHTSMTIIIDPAELQQRGFEALVAALGWVNAVLFIQQYETGVGDYTREREQILPDWDAAMMVSKMSERRPE